MLKTIIVFFACISLDSHLQPWIHLNLEIPFTCRRRTWLSEGEKKLLLVYSIRSTFFQIGQLLSTAIWWNEHFFPLFSEARFIHLFIEEHSNRPTESILQGAEFLQV